MASPTATATRFSTRGRGRYGRGLSRGDELRPRCRSQGSQREVRSRQLVRRAVPARGAIRRESNHPQIVSLYDYGSDGDAYFIVMEFIDGTSLADIFHWEAPLLPERAAEIALDVTRALDRAHTAGIVHRDIKPGNIPITKDGNTKVTDFGIARAADGDNEQTMTQTGMVRIGTAAYLSPEQAQGQPVDGRSDLYSHPAWCCTRCWLGTPVRGRHTACHRL